MLVPHHIALDVQDLARVVLFYSDFLGLPIAGKHHDEKGHLRSVWFQSGSVTLMLEKSMESSGESSGKESGERSEKNQKTFLLAFRISVSERDDWKKRLEEASIPITHESKHSIYFEDPEGNRLALSHFPTDR